MKPWELFATLALLGFGVGLVLLAGEKRSLGGTLTIGEPTVTGETFKG